MLLTAPAVVGGIASVVAGAVFALPAAADDPHRPSPRMAGMPDNPGMARMHERMMDGNPGMARMHEQMMDGARTQADAGD